MSTADIQPGDEPVTTPADELRAAAAKLRETAGEIVNVNGGDGFEKWTEFYGGDDDFPGEFLDKRDLAWIALVHPGLAEPLAAWLDAVAGGWEESAKISPGSSGARFAAHPALAVARVINGGAS